MTVKTIVGALVMLLTPAFMQTVSAANTSQVPVCPKTYPLHGVVLTKVPDGWVGEVDERLALQSASIAVGDPTFQNEIIPTESKKVRGGSEVVYGDLDGFDKQRWLVCGYGSTNVIKLYQKVKPGVKRCTMRYISYAGTTVYSLDQYHCE